MVPHMHSREHQVETARSPEGAALAMASQRVPPVSDALSTPPFPFLVGAHIATAHHAALHMLCQAEGVKPYISMMIGLAVT